MPSIPLSGSVAGTIHEHVGQSDQGNGLLASRANANAAFFPPTNTGSLRTKRCHDCVTRSRNQEDMEEPAGHQRTRRTQGSGPCVASRRRGSDSQVDSHSVGHR
jgi:hypothetical protein